MENGPGLKMYFLFKMGICHCHVTLPEGARNYWDRLGQAPAKPSTKSHARLGVFFPKILVQACEKGNQTLVCRWIEFTSFFWRVIIRDTPSEVEQLQAPATFFFPGTGPPQKKDRLPTIIFQGRIVKLDLFHRSSCLTGITYPKTNWNWRMTR